ncbi:MAG: Fic family protein [Microbacteriaceae bacterium]|nr:Fic family protein [Microbacteriaceae bacterium]
MGVLPFPVASGPVVPLIPTDIAATLEPSTLEVSGAAAAALEEFRGEFGPDDAAFAATLLRAEAAASARLGGLEADARETGLAERGFAAAADARAVASVLAATLHAFARPGDVAGVHEVIDPGGDDAVDDLALDGRTLLVPAALDHAWLVTSRPFFLGNGRTARAVLAARLGTALAPLPVSAGLLADAAAYHDALASYRRGDANPIVLVVARAIHSAVENARHLVTVLAITREEWDHAMVGVRSHASARDLVGVVWSHPVIDARLAVPELGVTLAAAYTAIETLVERGILVSRGPERRNRAWLAPALLGAVDAVVQRAVAD